MEPGLLAAELDETAESGRLGGIGHGTGVIVGFGSGRRVFHAMSAWDWCAPGQACLPHTIHPTPHESNALDQLISLDMLLISTEMHRFEAVERELYLLKSVRFLQSGP